jgi:CRISPR/Cas system-associated endonuclease Cas3-HD
VNVFDSAIRRGKEKAFAKGYERGAKEMAEYFSKQVIYSLHKDAVLSLSMDIDTLEKVVEVIEAVRDIGKA